ncbi:23S rRNA (adenine(2030)-N(6))-methyltransferase RlmJ [Granulosicoccaceae sp. 1_MG-2023]|nr:23S rRNA (adenine(2030)-N(6))-methyltransferase RlmJ [Granulosicoccaceae sp. 1_MG-2023]
MLSYKHGFHAGNYADVVKHAVLGECLRYMKQKPKPLVYIDTHAGCGGYRLRSDEARKTGEAEKGILKLLRAEAMPPVLSTYVAQVQALQNRPGAEDYYPGSPKLAADLLGPEDRLLLFEAHSAEAPRLRQRFARDARVRVAQSDGFAGLLANLPPPERRGVILIDPSYEVKSDYSTVISSLQKAHRRFAQGVFLLWYPVVERRRIKAMEAALQGSGIRRILQLELAVRPDGIKAGMTAAGLFVVNPPYTLRESMEPVLAYLSGCLAESAAAGFTCRELVGE